MQQLTCNLVIALVDFKFDAAVAVIGLFKETFLDTGFFEVVAPVNFKFDFAVVLTDFFEDTFLAAGTIGAVTAD
jgi:hypothetical protein